MNMLLPLLTYTSSYTGDEHSDALCFWKQCLEGLVWTLAGFVWPTELRKHSGKDSYSDQNWTDGVITESFDWKRLFRSLSPTINDQQHIWKEIYKTKSLGLLILMKEKSVCCAEFRPKFFWGFVITCSYLSHDSTHNDQYWILRIIGKAFLFNHWLVYYTKLNLANDFFFNLLPLFSTLCDLSYDTSQENMGHDLCEGITALTLDSS